MKRTLRCAVGLAGMMLAAQAGAQVTFYEGQDFHGRTFTTDHTITNFERWGFNDRASSVIVARDPWEVCEDAGFQGRCVVLRPGRYRSLAAMGLDNRISSAREIEHGRRADFDRHALESAPPVYVDYRRHADEPLYEANVTSVHAVMGPPEQRCWVEREQVAEPHGDASVPGAIVGGVIGGILGHQVGGGRGKDVATVGGAVGGAVLGANIGRQSGGTEVTTRDVQRCTSRADSDRIAYWDVTYWFRGLEHRVQMTTPPGPTLAVNAQGEPRV